MPSTDEALCGGHITLLFSIDKSARLKRGQGSRGVGFTVQHGVHVSGTLHTLVEKMPLNTMAGVEPDLRNEALGHEASSVTITDMHGQAMEDSTLYLDYIEACHDATLLRDHERLEVHVTLQCPTSQGFGMSAAGLVALGRLIHSLTGRGHPLQYLKIAHRIEREHGSGLGDVLGISVGGVELRRQPGAPGWPGEAVSFAVEAPVLLVWDAHEERHTSTYIDDPTWQTAITAAGEQGVKVLAKGAWDASRWTELLEQSRAFADVSGMLTEAVRARVYHAALEAVQDAGLQALVAVRLCMLGSSVAILPRRLHQPADEHDLLRLAEHIQERGLSTLLTAIADISPR
jgi:pantoate kinase